MKRIFFFACLLAGGLGIFGCQDPQCFDSFSDLAVTVTNADSLRLVKANTPIVIKMSVSNIADNRQCTDGSTVVTNPAGNSNTSFLLRNCPSGRSNCTATIADTSLFTGAIIAGQSVELTKTVTFPASGTYYLDLMADVNDQVFERNEYNNLLILPSGKKRVATSGSSLVITVE